MEVRITVFKKLMEDLRKLLVDNRVESTLDCGCGRAKLYPHFMPIDQIKRREGIEANRQTVNEEVIKSSEKWITQWHIGDFSSLLLDWSRSVKPIRFGAILFLDSLEHLPKNLALRTLDCADKITDLTIIFCPAGKFDGCGGKTEWDTHKSAWEASEFMQLGWSVNIYKDFHRPIGGGDALLCWRKK